MTNDDRAAHPAPIVRVRGVAVDGLLDAVSFGLAVGECVAIIDEHDVRRTALLRCIAGERRPDTGTIEAPNAAAVWHDDGLPDNETVRSAVVTRLGVDETRAEELLADLGLAHRADHEPWAMSAGERRRVAVQIALSSGAALIVLDEPERGLDKSSLAWLARKLRDVCAGGTTVIMATHNEWLADHAATVIVDAL